MAHIARSMKNIEPPRPLKAQRALLKNNFMVVEELIQLIENVALSLQSGVNDMEPMASLVQNLRSLGPQMERVSKDTLDRAFVVFRNASQDERLNIMTRLNLLELIELRAKGWEVTGFNSYYDTIRTTKATNIENPFNPQQHLHIADVNDATFLDTSPPLGAASAASVAADASAHRLLLGPGELIRNSGKFPKPTKIPGKTYCKDEVVIRNADSGKAMGMKGRRVHMIEGLSETIISFQRVNPGAKERLVQITGPSEEKINYAKQLIEDTIRRNASPVRLDPAMGAHTGGSCSSLASSNSDDATPRAVIGVGAGNLSNRLSLNTVQNFMTASAAAQQVAAVQQQATVAALLAKSASNAAAAAVAGEYKYTVNVGQHVIKITGDCCDLVRVAKLVLDDYFCSADFLVSVEARDALENTLASPLSAPSTPMGQQQFVGGFPLADSGIGHNYMAGQIASNIKDADDDVFADTNGASSQNNVLTRSRRSHFSRKDSTPEAVTSNAAQNKLEKDPITGKAIMSSPRIVYNYDSLLQYAHSPLSWALPKDWPKICEKFPSLVRNKVTHVSANAAPVYRVANINKINSKNTNDNNCNSASANALSYKTPPSPAIPPCTTVFENRKLTMQSNNGRKEPFNLQNFSTDAEMCSREKQPLPQQKIKDTSENVTTPETIVVNYKPDAAAAVYSVKLPNNRLPNNNNHIISKPVATCKDLCHLQKRLLNKQIQIISSIIENKGEKAELVELSDICQSDVIIIEDSDEDEVGKLVR